MRLRIALFWEAAKIALKSIWTHKLRAFLTLLGIIIGVASVVIVGAAISGLQTYVTDSVSKTLGSNSFIVARIAHVGRMSDEEFEKMVRRNKEPKLEDISYIRSRCPDCEQVAAEIDGTQNTYFGHEELLDTTVEGVTSNMMYLANLTVVEGRFFTDTEVDRSRPVCVIGAELKEKFFPHIDPIGQTIKIQNQPVRIIGVIEEMGSVFGISLDRVVYIPITHYLKSFGGKRGLTIRGKAVSRERFDTAVDQVRVALRAKRDLKPNEDDDFGLISTDDINDMVDQFTSAIAAVIVPITCISLLVGGIVVMNIMLVSVTERTFEIGIRKAVGARRRDIIYQFLIEAFLLAATGGALGLLLAYVLAQVVESSTSFPMTITIMYILLSLGVSGGIGIIFGIYPAVKASRLDPIVALSSER